MTRKHRFSHTSQGSGDSATALNDMFLSMRTRSISKSRRSSAVEEKPSSRRTSAVAALSLLSLPSFNEQLNGAQVTSALDVHAMYKVKINKSQRKLEYFFGEPTPVDVCVSEINKEGLKALLESKVPLCYFLYYLLDEFSSENLFFFLEVEHFESYKKKSPTKCKEMAQLIYDTYILDGSHLEINLEDKIKRNITDLIMNTGSEEEICPSLFTEAQTSVYIMLESSFTQFLDTPIYEDMIDNCGHLNIHYDDTITANALNYLTQYLRHQQDIVLIHSRDHTPLSNSFTDMSIKHHNLIKAILKGFIKDLFGVDYFDPSPSSSSVYSTCSPPKLAYLPSSIKGAYRKRF